MLTIDGQITSGLGAATGALSAQLPEIEKQFPAITGWHRGTINVILDSQLEVVRPDFVTTPIKLSRGAAEMFGFKRVRFEHGGAMYDAFLYIPYLSPHRKNPYQVEVLLRDRIEIGREANCKIHFDAKTTKVMA